MFSKALLAASALVGYTLAQSCPEASRFGGVTYSPNPIVLGQEVTFTGNFACAIELGYAPVFTDYFLEVPESNNTGFQPPVYIARRGPPPSGGIDTFTYTFDPEYSPFTTNPDAQYVIVVQTTHAEGSTLVTGSTSSGASIVQASD
ncbi:hypothetical protein BDP27DRAFT_1421711 [Rhodocollybia butyracea]|uniref:Uncharacterized protein n=1 Tax=Rhodocollybia butyracea TaxID=206335 RepID=A0A9P5PST0_9AGAR|nr:hypothetical protein BDP27DRAFT_1421711 [Rhodocollybia butyracea]